MQGAAGRHSEARDRHQSVHVPGQRSIRRALARRQPLRLAVDVTVHRRNARVQPLRNTLRT